MAVRANLRHHDHAPGSQGTKARTRDRIPTRLIFLFSLVASKLPNLLHLGVVRRRNAIQVGGDLRSQVLTRKTKCSLAPCRIITAWDIACPRNTDADEGLQDVLRHDIRVASLPNVFTVDIPWSGAAAKSEGINVTAHTFIHTLVGYSGITPPLTSQ